MKRTSIGPPGAHGSCRANAWATVGRRRVTVERRHVVERHAGQAGRASWSWSARRRARRSSAGAGRGRRRCRTPTSDGGERRASATARARAGIRRSVRGHGAGRDGGGIVEQVTDPRRRRERLTLLTVHAHPDDEASKGAPTVARYHAEGVHTVLVCCTGGEEGDLQNPTLREPGQPFHGLTPEEEKAKVAAMRPAELAESARIIGFDEVVMLGYRDSGMADTPPNEHPDSFHQADIDEATGRLVAVIRRTRPQVIITYGDDQHGLPAPRPPQGARHLRCWRSTGPATPTGTRSSASRSSRRSCTTRRGRGPGCSAVHERLLERDGKSPFDEKWFERPDQRPPHHDPHRRRRLPVRPLGGAAGPRHAGRPDGVVVVRPRRRRAGRRLPVGGLDPRPLARRADPRPSRSRTTCSPASARSVEQRVDDARSSTASSSARRTSSSTGPTTPTSSSRCRSTRCTPTTSTPTVAYMRGKLKSTGPTGPLFELLRSGEAAAAAQPARCTSLSSL